MNTLRRLKLREIVRLISDGTAAVRLSSNLTIPKASTLVGVLAGLTAVFLAVFAVLVGVVLYVEPLVFVGPAAVS